MTIKEKNLGYTSSAQSVWDDLYIDSYSNKIDEKYLADSVDIWLYNTRRLYDEIKNKRRKAYSVVYEALLSLFQTNVDDNLEGKKVKVTSEMVKDWFKKHNADFKEILKPVVDKVEESRQEMFGESSFSKRNNKKSPIKERIKGDYVLDRKDIFDDEDSITEARELHTWSVTYNGKGNKAKTHMVDAPDAYEANRKARRELGISYNDIEDVTMVENKSIDESIENDYGETLYRFIVGNGTYQTDVYYAYGYNEGDALDKVIDYLERAGSNSIYTFDEVENEGLYDDEYVVGGNHGVALRHYGEFRIETPDSDDTSDGEFITESKSSIKESKDNYNKYKLVDYYDVWGNEEDGFEVNDIAVIADDIVISDDADEQDILDLLYDMEYLNTKDPNKVYVNMSDFDMIELFDASNDCPIGRLERIW